MFSKRHAKERDKGICKVREGGIGRKSDVLEEREAKGIGTREDV